MIFFRNCQHVSRHLTRWYVISMQNFIRIHFRLYFFLLSGDLWPEDERSKGNEPDWVKTEKEQFTQYRDKNKDGKMDRDEVSDWIMPDDFDHVESEAKHLIAESDADKVKSLFLSVGGARTYDF